MPQINEQRPKIYIYYTQVGTKTQIDLEKYKIGRLVKWRFSNVTSDSDGHNDSRNLD